MTAKPAQTLHRIERRAAALQCFPAQDVAEVIGRKVGEQRHSDVGWRSALRGALDRVLLMIVRRQPILIGSDESIEEAPRPARECTQEQRFVAFELGDGLFRRPVQPLNEQRQRQPQ